MQDKYWDFLSQFSDDDDDGRPLSREQVQGLAAMLHDPTSIFGSAYAEVKQIVEHEAIFDMVKFQDEPDIPVGYANVEEMDAEFDKMAARLAELELAEVEDKDVGVVDFLCEEKKYVVQVSGDGYENVMALFEDKVIPDVLPSDAMLKNWFYQNLAAMGVSGRVVSNENLKIFELRVDGNLLEVGLSVSEVVGKFYSKLFLCGGSINKAYSAVYATNDLDLSGFLKESVITFEDCVPEANQNEVFEKLLKDLDLKPGILYRVTPYGFSRCFLMFNGTPFCVGQGATRNEAVIAAKWMALAVAEMNSNEAHYVLFRNDVLVGFGDLSLALQTLLEQWALLGYSVFKRLIAVVWLVFLKKKLLYDDVGLVDVYADFVSVDMMKRFMEKFGLFDRDDATYRILFQYAFVRKKSFREVFLIGVFRFFLKKYVDFGKLKFK